MTARHIPTKHVLRTATDRRLFRQRGDRSLKKLDSRETILGGGFARRILQQEAEGQVTIRIRILRNSRLASFRCLSRHIDAPLPRRRYFPT